MQVVTQGLWALEGYKLAFPAIASDPSGRAVIVASAFAAAKGPRGTDVPGVVYTGIGPLGLSKNVSKQGYGRLGMGLSQVCARHFEVLAEGTGTTGELLESPSR